MGSFAYSVAQTGTRGEVATLANLTRHGVLAASIAHEVNQPLTGIIVNATTCLRMLSADPPNVDGALETARRTVRDCNRATDVIKGLRALFGKSDVIAELVDLNEATREVIALIWNDLQKNGVILRQEFAVDLPLVRFDRVQLGQVIFNLLRNAADAMSGIDDRPRQLTIITEREGDDCVRLNVQDTGVGIYPHDTERIFDAFYTTKGTGMGIGLSISRAITERHHGRLWAVSNDGPGSTFSFSIPCESDDFVGKHIPMKVRTPTEDVKSPASQGRGGPDAISIAN
jgi:signal transduction histidine kinase